MHTCSVLSVNEIDLLMARVKKHLFPVRDLVNADLPSADFRTNFVSDRGLNKGYVQCLIGLKLYWLVCDNRKLSPGVDLPLAVLRAYLVWG